MEIVNITVHSTMFQELLSQKPEEQNILWGHGT